MSNKIGRFLTVKEVADIFGVNPMTIYRKVRAGELPAIKFGKSWLFPEESLRGWITSQTKGGKTPISKELQDISPALTLIPEIQMVYFFGSAATGFDTPLSDIDIAYLDDNSVSPFDLEPKIEKILLTLHPNWQRIDMARLNTAPIAIQYRVVRDGQLIYTVSDNIRASFEERVINQYLDYAQILNYFYSDSYKALEEAA